MKKKLLLSLICFSKLLMSQVDSRIKVTYQSNITRDTLQRDKKEFSEFTLLANQRTSIYYFENAKQYFNGRNEQSEKIITNFGSILKYRNL